MDALIEILETEIPAPGAWAIWSAGSPLVAWLITAIV